MLCGYNRCNRKRESVGNWIQRGKKKLYKLKKAKCTLLTGLPWCLRLYRVCLQLRRPRFNPWIRKIPWRREWQPTSGFLPGDLHQQRSLAGYIGSQRVDTGPSLCLGMFHMPWSDWAYVPQLLSPCSRACKLQLLKSLHLEPCFRTGEATTMRSRTLLFATGESPCTAVNTHHSQKIK